MELRFAALDLASLDELKTELLCLWMFSDERPPRGALGLVDWRLCGRLSRLLARGEFQARFGEALLMPPPEQRLAAERVLLLGAGTRAELVGERCGQLVREWVDRVLGLRVRTAALALPHASLPALDAVAAIDLVLAQAPRCEQRLDELVILDTLEAQRAMEPRIEREKRRALAAL